MCGIFFSASPRGFIGAGEETVRTLSSRGPDSLQERNVAVACLPSKCSVPPESGLLVYLTFISTVLALRGDHIQVQPMRDDATGSVLCWSGEAWKMNNERVTGNDTARVFEALLRAAKSPQSDTDRVEKVLTNIAGPYAFVFYDASSRTVYFGRDRLGRRSLMISSGDGGEFVLASTGVGLPKPCIEVDTSGVFRIRLLDERIVPERIDWTTMSPAFNKDALPPSSLQPRPPIDAVEALLGQLTASLKHRASDIPVLSHRQSAPDSAQIAVLFSGGLDCTLMARLLHDLLPPNEPIDLLNVAFENPRTVASIKHSSTLPSPYESCPDRITGRSSFAELAEVCPSRNWRFVAIDVPFSQVCDHRPTIIDLMYPQNTEMDLSIAMALYFAASGQGSCPSGQTTYTTSARVLLSGLGADELFAGYTRHATTFMRAGFTGLVNELEFDFRRIGTRNLGRDDRVISQWGKEVRYPYLDELFVEWALGLPVWEKCGFRSDKEVPRHFEGTNRSVNLAGCEDDLDPAKMLLRLAAWRLGMKRAAAERKRAIQFGARTAKMDVTKGGGRKKGTDVVE